VIALRYSPGGFLNALNPESAIRNENTWIGLEEESPSTTADHRGASVPGRCPRRLVVRQISGAVARRIVCDLRPGETLARGQKLGMIKLGSRTELIVPDDEGLTIEVQLGRKIKAGVTVMARYVAKPQAACTANP
jgi:phosphatidylserine decarboxylase